MNQNTVNQIKNNKKRNFPKSSIEVLAHWYQENVQHPYPNQEQKKELARNSGLTIKQVNDWYINTRRKEKTSKKKRRKTAAIHQTLHGGATDEQIITTTSQFLSSTYSDNQSFNAEEPSQLLNSIEFELNTLLSADEDLNSVILMNSRLQPATESSSTSTTTTTATTSFSPFYNSTPTALPTIQPTFDFAISPNNNVTSGFPSEDSALNQTAYFLRILQFYRQQDTTQRKEELKSLQQQCFEQHQIIGQLEERKRVLSEQLGRLLEQIGRERIRLKEQSEKIAVVTDTIRTLVNPS